MRERGVKEDSKAPGTSVSQRLWKAMVLESPLIPATSIDTTKLCEVSCEGNRCFAHMSSGIINKRSPDFQSKARISSPYITWLCLFSFYTLRHSVTIHRKRRNPGLGCFRRLATATGLLTRAQLLPQAGKLLWPNGSQTKQGPLYAGKFPR